ncbi:TraY domain-containing protein [Xenorhabdus sp. XENO-1]|uniref:TraY domain-containing protein n=1 Tax=Xenorhabdus bovienii TaxID=40576 RepID=UPI0020CA3748|nr:TraY domain-containing protein [Xenorhabdus bovienii]MCP9269137.1 TraY domain-containing protein [Xenorhabdus bovienii subsp. africana]
MRRNTRSALGPAVQIRLDEETNCCLIRAKERSGRSKSSEVTLRIEDHLNRFPDFYNPERGFQQRSTQSGSRIVVQIRLDEEVSRRLIKVKNRSGRSKSSEVALRIKDHLEIFPDFYNSELAEEMLKNKK